MPAPEPTVQDAAALAAEFLPRFRESGWWKGPVRAPSKAEDGSIVLGYRAPSGDLFAFEDACYQREFCFSFDWTAWGGEARRLIKEPGAIEAADLLDLRKLLTTFIRQNRFADGVLLEMAEAGILTRILERFAELGRG